MANREGPVSVWRLITHHGQPDEYLRRAMREGRLAVGWSYIGDIIAHGYRTARDIAKAIKKDWPDRRNAGHGGASLYHFCYGVKPHDLVILSTGHRRACVMIVTGPYDYENERKGALSEDYQHQRTAVLVDKDANALWRDAGGSVAAGHNIRWTFVKCQRSVEPLD